MKNAAMKESSKAKNITEINYHNKALAEFFGDDFEDDQNDKN